MLLGDLLNSLASRRAEFRLAGPSNIRVCDLTEDSRTVVPGSLFIARAGLKSDGNRFVADALRAGAVAVLTDDPNLSLPNTPVAWTPDVLLASALLAERFYGEPSSRLGLVGVTGTNGKTTTSFLVWRMLNALEHRCGLVGTVLVDDGREVARAAMTTPPAVELSRTLASMVECGCTHAAMEVSSHSLDQRRCDALRFRVGIFTNLTGDHLDYHKTMDQYAAAKARLFELLAQGAAGVVNVDDPAGARMLARCRGPVLRCTAGDAGAECRVRIAQESLGAMGLELAGPWGRLHADVPLIGSYNAMNVLQATAACHILGLSAEDLGRALLGVQAPPGRLERVSTPADTISVFVDYAHSDDSLRNVLRAVSGVLPGRAHAGSRLQSTAGTPSEPPDGPRLWVVFGCGGDRDRTKRPRMGRAAADLADAIVVTSDNPRTEVPSAIIDEILAGIPGEQRHKVRVDAERERAIHAAVAAAAPGDAIVIAGKGHETEQVLPDGRGGTYSIHFDDAEIARAALAARRGPAARQKTKPSAPSRAHAGREAGASERRRGRAVG